MKKIIKSLLILTLVGTSLKCATNKTHNLPRSYGVNLAMEYTTWNELLQTKNEDRFGSHFQVVPFYQGSEESYELGKYFGVHDKNSFVLGSNPDAAVQRTYDVDALYMLHYPYGENPRPAGKATIKYHPKQEAYGLRIDYYQGLDKILKGLYLKTALPIVRVENDMQLHIDNFTILGALVESVDDIYKYFSGNFSVPVENGSGQKALTRAKIHGDQSTTQLADIDIVFGYKILDKEKYHLSINLGLTIPTSNQAEGIWVFEAQAGNGNHWGLGAGFDFGTNLWTKKKQNIKLESALNYRYLFDGSEKRTIKLKDMRNGDGAKINTAYSQYFLLANITDPAGTPLTPAANILTKELSITPGSQIDAILALAYNNGGFRFELGYNFFWKNIENIKINHHWKDETYYLVNPALFDPANQFVAADGYEIKKHNLDKESAATPSQNTNKIYSGLGYIFKDWRYPLMAGLGAHYEFADEHEGGIENWGIWGKLGVAF